MILVFTEGVMVFLSLSSMIANPIAIEAPHQNLLIHNDELAAGLDADLNSSFYLNRQGNDAFFLSGENGEAYSEVGIGRATMNLQQRVNLAPEEDNADTKAAEADWIAWALVHGDAAARMVICANRENIPCDTHVLPIGSCSQRENELVCIGSPTYESELAEEKKR